MNESIHVDDTKFSCEDNALARDIIESIRVVVGVCVYGINMFLLLYILQVLYIDHSIKERCVDRYR